MYGKSNMETYITICKTESQQEFAVWLRKLKQGLCVNLEGWGEEGDGRQVQKGGDICIPLYAGQEATVRIGHGTTDQFQIGKGVRQGVYCHPVYLTYMQSTS